MSSQARILVVLGAVGAGLLLLVSSAGASHVPGARYSGKHSGSNAPYSGVTFVVTDDGAAVFAFDVLGVPGDDCTFGRVFLGPTKIPIIDDRFSYQAGGVDLTGAFTAPQAATGTFQDSVGTSRLLHQHTCLLDGDDDDACRHDAAGDDDRLGTSACDESAFPQLQLQCFRARDDLPVPPRRQCGCPVLVPVPDRITPRRGARVRRGGGRPECERRSDACVGNRGLGHRRPRDDHYKRPQGERRGRHRPFLLPLGRAGLEFQLSSRPKTLAALRLPHAIQGATARPPPLQGACHRRGPEHRSLAGAEALHGALTSRGTDERPPARSDPPVESYRPLIRVGGDGPGVVA